MEPGDEVYALDDDVAEDLITALRFRKVGPQLQKAFEVYAQESSFDTTVTAMFCRRNRNPNLVRGVEDSGSSSKRVPDARGGESNYHDPKGGRNGSPDPGGGTKALSEVYTMYKPKSRKVQPLDNVTSDGSVPEGDPKWRDKAWAKVEARATKKHKFDELVTPKFSDIQKGSRLTQERLAEILATCEHLTPGEQELLAHVLFNREKALAWEFKDCGRVHPSVAPPQVLKVVEHKAWQSPGIPIPKALRPKVIQVLRERYDRGIIEEGHGPYRNVWFLVVKKDGGLRLINSATKINAVTPRDAFIPPGAEEFSEDFGMCKALSLLDFFSGYDQVPLDVKSRDLTTFATPLGLFRMCTLPQGATNSVAQFMRVITRILTGLIPEVCRAFIDDITVRGPESTYEDAELKGFPGIRKFMAEHIANLDKVLVNTELAECTISGKKSQFCQKTCVIVGYVCGTQGRAPETAKIIKIMEWKKCDNTTEVKSFLGIVGYYRIWILRFAIVADPLTKLLRKEVVFVWEEPQAKAMAELQRAITTAPILVSLTYGPNAGLIILAVDASLWGWGAILMQIVEGKRHPHATKVAPGTKRSKGTMPLNENAVVY